MKKFLSTLLLLVFAFVGLQAKDEKDAKVRQVLVIAEQGTPHQGFCDAAQQWLEAHAERLNIQMTYVSDLSKTKKGYLNQFQLILQLNYPPYCPPQAWSKEAGADFEKYIDEGKGGYVGFHHASLLGDIFGAGPMWQWYSDFMGDIRWKDYIAPLADGTVIKEGVVMAVLFTLVYALGGNAFLGLLTDDKEVIAAADTYFYWALAVPAVGIAAFIWDGIFIGATATRGMLLSMATAAASFFVLYYGLHPVLANHALWLAFLTYLLMRGVMQTGLSRVVIRKAFSNEKKPIY